MPPKFSSSLNFPKPNKPSGLGGNANKLSLAGQKRKKTIFDDGSDSETEQANGNHVDDNNQSGAIEITTLGGLDDQDEQQQQEGEKEEERDTRKKSRINTGLSSAKPPNSKSDPKALKSSIFDDEHDEGATTNTANINNHTTTKKYGLHTVDNKNYVNLAALHSSRKHVKEAEEIDPSIYSYDAVYDSIKAKRDKPKQRPSNNNGEDGEGEDSSKYMSALMRSAEIRKRDQMRARDRLLAKEREAEGDEFTDKEKFVTAAYRAQQEEVKRMEEEEAAREKAEEERRRRTGESGMMGFYRQMLARDEEMHDEVMKATEEAAAKIAKGETAESAEYAAAEGEKSDAQLAAELNSRGANIILNDEGQVVDKRQLLSAGLNIAPKSKAKIAASTRTGGTSAAAGARFGVGARSGPRDARDAQRARQTEMIAAQLEEKARQEEEAEKARQKELAEKNKSRKTESDVSSARERYLARKREKEAQAQKQS